MGVRCRESERLDMRINFLCENGNLDANFGSAVVIHRGQGLILPSMPFVLVLPVGKHNEESA